MKIHIGRIYSHCFDLLSIDFGLMTSFIWHVMTSFIWHVSQC